VKTGSQLEDLLVEILTGAAGGTAERWRAILGPVTVYPMASRPASNWSVQAGGTVGEAEAIEMAVGIVRAEHPYASSAA
jgi:hypothetical protein